ncbi:MAG: energy-coupling factor transporter ATPase [Clostridia bacterium]|nr:energy-coupling factor transporter ATPase [Clostridia bacterium]
MSAVLELRGVSFYYGAGTPFEKKALSNIDLSLDKGDTVGVIGHTGSGKSTLVQTFNGLLKPSEGTVLFEGVDIHRDKKTLHEIRFKVGLVFQYPEYQLFAETVREDIAYGPQNMGLDKDEIENRVIRAARSVGLDEKYLGVSPFDLSGGLKRRAAIAGIMAMEPEVLVLDEPSAGLDPKGREDIYAAVSEYRERTGATVVFISHSMEDMARYAKRMIVVSGGSIAMNGTPKEVFTRFDELAEMGLDIPQISRLLAILREKGIPEQKLPRDIFTVSEAENALLTLLKGGDR